VEAAETPRKLNYWRKVLPVLLFSVLYISAWVCVLSIRTEVGSHHSKVPLMLIEPPFIPFMACFILSLWALAFHEHKRIIPLVVWLVAALCIVAGYSALGPALSTPELSRVLNVPQLSYISNVLLFAFGISLLVTAFGVTTMKKRWFYTTIALSALSTGVFSWVPLFSLFPIPIVYPAWLIAVAPWPIEIPVISYLIWKRNAFLKANGGTGGDSLRRACSQSPL